MTAEPPTAQEAARLNAQFESASPTEILRWAVDTFRPEVALTSSFGAESAALLHMAIQVDPRINVRMVDTGLLFPETYQFMEELRKRFHLNLTIVKSKLDVPQFLREHEGQAPGHPDFCCSPHKVEAMERALRGLRGWIAGLSRSEAKTREETPIVQVLTTGVTKVAPLAAWSPQQVHAYMTQHQLPHHPLWAKGYASIGCWPCTVRPVDPNDPRSGRWPGQDKTECGIHDLGQPPSDQK
jgi:phosphoadenosine phosphosulfate reductase